MDNLRDNQPASSLDRRSEHHSAKSGDWQNSTHNKEAGVVTQQHSVARSDGPQHSEPQNQKEDNQGLLLNERCEVSNGGSALTVVNTRTGERTAGQDFPTEKY